MNSLTTVEEPFCLKATHNVNKIIHTDNSNECTYVKFDIEIKDEFKHLLSNKINVINEMTQAVETNADINSVVQDSTTFMHEVTHDVFLKNKTQTSSTQKKGSQKVV